MKAIILREFGGPEMSQLEDVLVPRVAATDVLIKVTACGVISFTRALAREVVEMSRSLRRLGFTNNERKRLIDRVNKTVDTMRALDRQCQNIEKKIDASRNEDQKKDLRRQSRQIRADLDKADAAFAAADNALSDKDFVTYAKQIKLAQRYVSQALALADSRPSKKD